ncbi:hypothetical protein E2320_018125, partial [Naja naja]
MLRAWHRGIAAKTFSRILGSSADQAAQQSQRGPPVPLHKTFQNKTKSCFERMLALLLCKLSSVFGFFPLFAQIKEL